MRLDLAHRREQHWVESHACAQAEQHHAREDVHEVAPVDGGTREPEETKAREPEPGRERRPEAEAHHELRGNADREHTHDQVAGKERETDLERAVPQHELHVERRQEEPGEHRAGPENSDDVGGREVAKLEQPERHQRRGRANLAQDEDDEERQRDAEQAERFCRRPAVLVGIHDRVNGDDQRAGDRDRARDVEARRGRNVNLGQEPQGEQDDHDADREVDEEDPVPADQVGDDPAEQDAEASAARGDEPEDSHRLRALARLGEEVDHERQRDGGSDGASDPLHAARDHEHPLRGREPAGERRDREHGDSDQEEAALAVQVAEPAAEQQKASVREQVRVHHPREGRVGEAEVVLDRGQRDADDRDVEDDHQARQAEDVEGEPAGSGVEFAHRLLVPFVRFRSLRRSNDRELIGRPSR